MFHSVWFSHIGSREFVGFVIEKSSNWLSRGRFRISINITRLGLQSLHTEDQKASDPETFATTSTHSLQLGNLDDTHSFQHKIVQLSAIFCPEHDVTSTHAPTLRYWYFIQDFPSSAFGFVPHWTFFSLAMKLFPFRSSVLVESFICRSMYWRKSVFHVFPPLFSEPFYYSLPFIVGTKKIPHSQERQTFLVLNYNLFSHETTAKLYADDDERRRKVWSFMAWTRWVVSEWASESWRGKRTCKHVWLGHLDVDVRYLKTHHSDEKRLKFRHFWAPSEVRTVALRSVINRRLFIKHHPN